MEGSIWTGTLASFRDRVAGAESVPAGVSAAAVSATLGLGLLTKVLEIASKRKDFAGDPQQVRAWIETAGSAAQLLSRLADDDIAAFHQYLKCLRLPKSTDEQRKERQQAMDAAMRNAIEVPLRIARAAASGLDLCEKATGLAHAFIAPDLGAASALLAGAVRATLLSVNFNVQQLPEGDPYRNDVTAEALRLAPKKRKALTG